MNRDELLAAILQALGEASVCWSNIDGAGVFQSDKAIEIAGRLANRIPLQMPPVVVTGNQATDCGTVPIGDGSK
jgi:hypothetical protein